MSLPPDLIDLCAEFDALNVDYLLVGGHAVAVHGHPRFTKDADLWLRDTEDNTDRAVRALERFGAPPAVIDGIRDAQGLDVVWMGHPPVRIDLMKAVPGGDFERAWNERKDVVLAGTVVHVIGREELVRIKQASGRPQDLEDARKLRMASG